MKYNSVLGGKKLFLILVVLSLTLAGTLPMARSVQALTISPARLELTGDPGKTISGEIILVNEQSEAKTFYSSFENFEAQGESGVPNFVPGTTDLAGWLHAPNNITLAPGEQKKIPFTVVIDQKAEPGGHFAAIFWSTTPPQGNSGQLAVGAKIGTLVLLKVSGSVKEDGGLVEFSTTNHARWFSRLPVTFFYRIRNNGGDRLKPSGNVSITSMLGSSVAVISANPSENNILPSSVRKFELMWGEPAVVSGFWDSLKYEWNHFALGIYTANLSLHYGSDQSAAAVYKVYIFPWHLLIFSAFALFVLFTAGITGIKRYNKWVIARARQGG